MNGILEQNLLYLYNNNIDIFNKVNQYLNNTDEKIFKLVLNEDQNPNISYYENDELELLYSEDGSDITEWLEQYSDLYENKFDVVMYGLGLTHHLVSLIQLNSNLNFYIYEPNLDIFVESLKIVEMSQLLSHLQIKKLIVGNNYEDILSFHLYLNTYCENKRTEVFIPYYTKFDMQNMRDFYKTNYQQREGKLFTVGFAQKFKSLPYENSFLNLEKMVRSTSISALKNQFFGCTVLVVGAGPSLELDVELIKENYNKFIIMAAGSSIQSLLHYGIKPHIIVSMDPSEANGRVFKNVDVRDIPFVFMPQIFSGILTEHFSRMYFGLFNNDPVTNYLFNPNGVDYNFNPTASVTGTAIQLAKYIGTKKIVLTGQDLSFPNENYYSKGATHLDDNWLSSKIVTSELTVDNVNGSQNKTNISMRTTLKDIETLLTLIDDVEFINTSALGAQITGAPFLPFSEMLLNVSEIECDLSVLKNAPRTDITVNLSSGQIMNKLLEIIDKCNEFIQYNKTSLQMIKKIDTYSRSNPDKSMNLLAKLEQQVAKVTEDPLFLSIILSWDKTLTIAYDQQVIKIEKEPSMIGKSKLLNEFLVPYLTGINESNEQIKETIQHAVKNLEENIGILL